jgi:hypothetical protein
MNHRGAAGASQRPQPDIKLRRASWTRWRYLLAHQAASAMGPTPGTTTPRPRSLGRTGRGSSARRAQTACLPVVTGVPANRKRPRGWETARWAATQTSGYVPTQHAYMHHLLCATGEPAHGTTDHATSHGSVSASPASPRGPAGHREHHPWPPRGPREEAFSRSLS